MITHNLIQGSDAWNQFRLTCFGASEAAAMLGISPKIKRNELLHIKHTGNPKQYSDWVQQYILDPGHVVEALARPIIEERIGEDLYPVTCSDGAYAASCDGLTMSEEIAFEHKIWNEKLARAVADGIVPDEYMPQCQQILMVTGAQKVIFVVSDGTADKMVSIEVLPDIEWFKRLKAGWAQFEKDLASYQPREIVEKPKAAAIIGLPALSVQIRGEVIVSNLPQYQAAAKTFIASIKTDLKTDDDFANAEATVKFCHKTEKDLELAKHAALAQTVSIDELIRTIDYIKEELRSNRLMLEKRVDNKKTEIKEKILKEARAAHAAHIASLNAEIRPLTVPYEVPDFIGAAKGKRTLASLHDAVDSVLANAKIAADATAKDIRAKLQWCRDNAEGYGFLFADMQFIIQKPLEDFQLVVNTRIAEHKKAEAAKLAQQLADAEAKRAAEKRVSAPLPQSATIEVAAIAAANDAQDAVIVPAPQRATTTPGEREQALAEARCDSAEDAFRWILLLCMRSLDDQGRRDAIAQIALIAEANLHIETDTPLARRPSDEATTTRIT